ncbi:SIS domain-containing protein [Streptomyces sp. TR06-5]|uniref:SIS domain-containing protein n=1 Tax=unclassified Streptomyces TaxID=2593676 RepID=UPI0039A3C66F
MTAGTEQPPSLTETEIATQPHCWQRAADEADGFGQALPQRGERVAVSGCGTSWFMAQAYAALREASGQGETDAFAASEFPAARAESYDRVVVITRSGTTTEVLDLLGALRNRTRTVALTADPAGRVLRAADRVAVLDHADEESVVQTRFATTALAFLRAGLEQHGSLPVKSVAEAAADAENAVAVPLPAGAAVAEQWTFLGSGWTYGLALEAALKMREAAGAWTEAYPSMEYRHGPIAIAAPRRVVWQFGALPEGLAEDIAGTGAELVAASRDAERVPDPMADLIRAQRLAVEVARARGCDPDRPRNLTRSVVLDG